MTRPSEVARKEIPTLHGPVWLRSAEEEDAAAWIALHLAVLDEEAWFVTESDELDGDPERAAAFIAAVKREANSLFLVACSARGLEGVLIVQGGRWRRTQHVGHVEVYLRPEARGMGIGGALLDEAIRWASGNELIEKLSLAVMAHNARAIALYERAGFVVEGHRLGEYRFPDGSLRDDLLMALKVRR